MIEKMRIPMEVVDCDGYSIYNTDEILERWKSDYIDLLNSENSQNLKNFTTKIFSNIK